jgi:competence protein ComEC
VIRTLLLSVTLFGCAPAAVDRRPSTVNRAAPTCGGAPLRVHFYDVGQALSALVILPDGRRVLVDAGESPKRPTCGKPCEQSSEHLIGELRKDLGDRPIDLLWITHQHSDHLGGVPEVAASFHVLSYVDNGTDLERPSIERARAAATQSGAKITVVDPEHATAPIANAAPVTFRAMVPSKWPGACHKDANDCSIGLRIDYCKSSILFVGDAEAREETLLDPGHVTLLQVGHHGSHSSTTDEFLLRTAPRYAVISSAKPGEAMNATYCHPRAGTVERLARALGGPGNKTIRAFSGQSCANEGAEAWVDIAVPPTLFSTARDGDVRLVTTGDGTFSSAN